MNLLISSIQIYEPVASWLAASNLLPIAYSSSMDSNF